MKHFVYHTRESVVGPDFNSWELQVSTPPQEAIFNCPQVQELLDTDTESIAPHQYRAVEPDIYAMMQKYFRKVLKTVVGALDGNAGESGGSFSPEDSQDSRRIVEDIDGMKSKLLLATSAWVCRVGGCRVIHWFPQILAFMDSFKPVENSARVLRNASPLDADGKLLLRRMLIDLGRDPNSSTIPEVTGLTNIICARCDPRIARYSSFAEIVRRRSLKLSTLYG